MSPVTTDNEKKTLYQAPILWIACKGWDVYKSNRNLTEGNTNSTQQQIRMIWDIVGYMLDIYV